MSFISFAFCREGWLYNWSVAGLQTREECQAQMLIEDIPMPSACSYEELKVIPLHLRETAAVRQRHKESEKWREEHLRRECPCADEDCSSESRTGRSSTLLPVQKNQCAMNTDPGWKQPSHQSKTLHSRRSSASCQANKKPPREEKRHGVQIGERRTHRYWICC